MIVMTVPVTTSGEAQQGGEDRCQEKGQRAGDNNGTEHGNESGTAAFCGAYGQDRGDCRKRRALHKRLTGTDLPNTDGLQDGGQARDKETRRNKVGNVRTRQAEGVAHNEGNSDDAGVHAQDVLQAVERHLWERQDLIDGMLARCSADIFV